MERQGPISASLWAAVTPQVERRGGHCRGLVISNPALGRVHFIVCWWWWWWNLGCGHGPNGKRAVQGALPIPTRQVANDCLQWRRCIPTTSSGSSCSGGSRMLSNLGLLWPWLGRGCGKRDWDRGGTASRRRRWWCPAV
jgi:hypothetical protein